MNCLNKEDLQRYIDKEVSARELESFNEHISGCRDCRTLLNKTKDELDQLMNLLSKVELDESEIVVPEFKSSTVNHYRLFRYISIAASILLVFGATWFYQNNAERKQAMNNASLELEQILYHSDSNKAWNKKEPLMTITNKEGEIIFTTFED